MAQKQTSYPRNKINVLLLDNISDASVRELGAGGYMEVERINGAFSEAEILPPVPYRHWTFTMPRAIRSLFERDRKLLGLLSRTGYEAIHKSFQALFDRKDVRPGCVISIQTFGAYGANFHPHLHAIVSDGVFTPEGNFSTSPRSTPERVAKSSAASCFVAFMTKNGFPSASWTTSFRGFIQGSRFSPARSSPRKTRDSSSDCRATLPGRRLPPTASAGASDGQLEIRTPPDPRTGATVRLFNPLDWIHVITAHIPDRGQHQVRYDGAFSNRARSSAGLPKGESRQGAKAQQASDEESEFTRGRRASSLALAP